MKRARQSIGVKDRGAVLLTTLLVMALMASLSVAIFDELRVAVKRAASINAQAQALSLIHISEPTRPY